MSTPRIPDQLNLTAREHADRIGWIDNGHPHRFADTEALTACLAGGLQALGLRRGDRIGVIAPNRMAWLWLFFASARLGVAVVGLSVRYRDAELRHMVNDSAMKAVFTVAAHDNFDFLAMFDRLAPETPTLEQVVDLDGERFQQLLRAEPVPVAPELNADDLAMVIYTSGTTGRPKGTALTHASMLASAAAQAAHTRMIPEDHTQLALPFNHVGGITCGILTSLMGGATCELVADFKADRVLAMMAEHPPTLLQGVPTMLTLLLMDPALEHADLSRVRMVITGGSNVDDTLLTRLQQTVPAATLMNLYGLSESSGAIVMTPWECDDDSLKRCIGQPLADAGLRVVDEAGTDLPAGEVGELLFRGVGVVPGYIGAAEESDTFDDDGWLHTGDLGERDSNGMITLRGRKKDMFIQGGFNVYPAEVENHIARLDQVMMVAGIGVPDAVLGEVGCYYVVPRPGSDLDEAAVLEHCRQALADYKVPRRLVFRDSLPLTPAGKIQKALLREAVPGERHG
ncbi:long-chain-fatty-acid--CoA ligase [Alcanivorax balearicus MACL04]|jgi:acyl-CoA synthetase (AMP-forming)/AMP-acid ligase II|uniref:Long-chain-fatty-acid--CoA ligase n=1 Tax=Alloalcanivorax balearicus MACL04 TaxID=1177182 RepID=A0ABT2R313_9GAMM|nr:AMP-binding protein [Alloalcanivorax balearicus]MCU5784165.1 long-chain-fatty-acid--CoA ligase [Alloalcanivorax balearicus MACL04]